MTIDSTPPWQPDEVGTLRHRIRNLEGQLETMKSRLNESSKLAPPSGLYVPALCEGLRYQMGKANKGEEGYVPAFADMERFKKGYGFSWWTKDSPFYYPRILVSAFYGMKSAHFFRDEYEIGKEVFFMGDSGGFQIATSRKKGRNLKGLTPINVLEWLKENCDAGLALDIPPTLGGDQPSQEEYEWAKNVLNENNQIYERHRDDLMVYNILHGETDERMEDWYNTVKDTSFEGWAVGLKPSSHPILQARGLGFMAGNGHTDNIHVLGASGFDVMPLFAHASKTINNLTYDSSSYNRGVIERQYMAPMNIKMKMHFGTKEETEGTKVSNTKLHHMPCNCPICTSVKPEYMFKEGSETGSLLSMHNLYWYLFYSDTLKILSEGSDSVFRGFVGGMCKEHALLGIDIFDAKIANDDIEYERLMSLASQGAQNKATEKNKKKRSRKIKDELGVTMSDEQEALAKAMDIQEPGWDELF